MHAEESIIRKAGLINSRRFEAPSGTLHRNAEGSLQHHLSQAEGLDRVNTGIKGTFPFQSIPIPAGAAQPLSF